MKLCKMKFFPINFTYENKIYTASVLKVDGMKVQYFVSSLYPLDKFFPDPFVVSGKFTYSIDIHEYYGFCDTIVKTIEKLTNP